MSLLFKSSLAVAGIIMTTYGVHIDAEASAEIDNILDDSTNQLALA